MTNAAIDEIFFFFPVTKNTLFYAVHRASETDS